MKVLELLERRRQNWEALERFCDQLQGGGVKGPKIPPDQMARFAALYRAACADLALAGAYQLPQNTVQYLHRLVGRAHNQLYRSRKFEWRKWADMLLFDVPQRVFNDRCVQLMFIIFWGLFILSAWLAYEKNAWPDYAEQVIGQEQITQLEEMYKNPIDGSQRDGDSNAAMMGFYVDHNASIGIQCFAWGLLVIPGLLSTMFNAIFLGAAFGYMARPDVPEGQNFFHFVTAHGPFELTAIVISAGSGLRLGLSWMMPGQLSRYANLQKTGREMMPVIGAAVVMFAMAAMIEGFVSPSALWYSVKVGVAIVSSLLLTFYFFVLGFPRSWLGVQAPPQQQPPMQLDNTRIAVRERGLLEALDLALHVTREFAWPWLLCSLMAIVPLALLNYFLIGWMADIDPDADTGNYRLLWNMTVLIYLEAPLASIFVVAYLGPAVFLEKRSLWQVMMDVARCSPHLFLCQLLLRGILPAWLLYLAVDRYAFDGFLEGFVLTLLALYATGIRALRPYINEIILLEKNPLLSKKSGAVTINRRSGDLHGPSSADLVVRWFGSAMVAVLLAALALVTASVAMGLLLSMWPVSVDVMEEEVTWQLSWVDVQVVYPACLWLVVAYMSVVRFLNYLDLRIRHEGWEVELLMRAEALRMQTKLG